MTLLCRCGHEERTHALDPLPRGVFGSDALVIEVDASFRKRHRGTCVAPTLPSRLFGRRHCSCVRFVAAPFEAQQVPLFEDEDAGRVVRYA